MSARKLALDEFPCPIDEIENVWIPLRDGCRLAARLWLPKDRQPVPALLEYLPYRKRDSTRSRDEPMHRYFAGHGYACARVDVRGSGDSDGILQDEYSQQEWDDGLEVLAWLASQRWCDGSVGMFGKSWGGFNALQIAALNPPELKAVISVCAADDRYADDAHYMGGCLLNENLLWGSSLFTFNAYPPDPEISGSAWRDKWLQRLENATLFPAVWMQHQRRDDYWRHGSVCEDYGAIRCPVFAVGGWADAYSNAVPRLLAGLDVPRKGLIGPWAHAYPQDGVPGPAIGFLQEALRWWDQWLKGRDTGITDEPMLRVWMQDPVEPRSTRDEQPGRWVAEACWPSSRIAPKRLHLAPRQLLDKHGGDARLSICSPTTTGIAAGEWCPFSGKGDLPFDQRWDDSGSLVFDSEPLGEDFEILGGPVAQLELAADRSYALLAIRLNDIAPDGASERVTYGLFNLAHRDGHATERPLTPGERVRLSVPLNAIAHRFPAGHRLRLAISTNYWPIAWPSPEPATITLGCGASTLELPVRPRSPLDDRLAPFPPPEMAKTDHEPKPTPGWRRIERDLKTDEVCAVLESGGDGPDGIVMNPIPPIALDTGSFTTRRYCIGESDPLSAEATIHRRVINRRGPWSTTVDTEMKLTATRDSFRLRARLTAREGEAEIFTRSWDEEIPRDGL